MRLALVVVIALLLAGCGDGEPLTPADALLPDGARYRGELVNGLLQGEGRLDYANGSWFKGRFKDGQPDGPGEWHGAAGEHYVGSFRQGLFDGQGRLTFANGGHYEGGFRQGLRDGEGQLEQGAERYSGEFRDNLFHGYGWLQQADGSSFQGRFERGVPSGEGVRTSAQGDRFSGRFSRGKLSGEGSYLGRDGEHYSGGFRHDQFHGKGRFASPDGAVWAGQFKHGALDGAGEFHDIDGSVYQGQFNDWEFSGQGVLTQADGQQEKGEWRAGERVRDAQGQRLADPLEIGLLQQGDLLARALDGVAVSTPAIELFSLTVAGDGNQSVFLREAQFVDQLLAGRFAAHGQISLVNHREHLADRPLATREAISRAIQTLAQRSGPEDLVFVFMTSHGSPEHELALQQPRLQLADLPAAELAELMAPLKDRFTVLVVSACFSGGFVAPLKSPKTLIITAARADRVSFGCTEEADFTYFGRALFAEALQQTDRLDQAFRQASAAVAAREQAEGFEASEPQIWAAPAVLAQWQKMRDAQLAILALIPAKATPP